MCFKTQKFEGLNFGSADSKYRCLVDCHENIAEITSSLQFKDFHDNSISVKKVYIFLLLQTM